MATIGYAGLPIPGGGDAPTWPAALAELATAIDPHLWQHAADLAERNAKYAGAPLHTVVTANNGSVWVKTSGTANTWATIHEPLPAWAPLNMAAGYETSVPLEYRIVGKRAYLRGAIQRIDGALINGGGGAKIGTVPNAAIPAVVGRYAGLASLTGDATIGAGRIEILPGDTAATAGPGAILWYSQDGSPGTIGVAWVDISGAYWLD